MIKGITVTLWTKTQTGTDSLNQPVYEWNSEQVDNVLVGQPTPEERLTELNLSGRAIEYTLGIPKGDNSSDICSRRSEFLNRESKNWFLLRGT